MQPANSAAEKFMMTGYATVVNTAVTRQTIAVMRLITAANAVQLQKNCVTTADAVKAVKKAYIVMCATHVQAKNCARSAKCAKTVWLCTAAKAAAIATQRNGVMAATIATTVHLTMDITA